MVGVLPWAKLKVRLVYSLGITQEGYRLWQQRSKPST